VRSARYAARAADRAASCRGAGRGACAGAHSSRRQAGEYPARKRDRTRADYRFWPRHRRRRRGLDPDGLFGRNAAVHVARAGAAEGRYVRPARSPRGPADIGGSSASESNGRRQSGRDGVVAPAAFLLTVSALTFLGGPLLFVAMILLGSGSVGLLFAYGSLCF